MAAWAQGHGVVLRWLGAPWLPGSALFSTGVRTVLGLPRRL